MKHRNLLAAPGLDDIKEKPNRLMRHAIYEPAILEREDRTKCIKLAKIEPR